MIPYPSGTVLIKKVNENNDFVESNLTLGDVPAQITGSLIYSDGNYLEETGNITWDPVLERFSLSGDLDLKKSLASITVSGALVLEMTPSGALTPAMPQVPYGLANKEYVDSKMAAGLSIGTLDGASKNSNAATISSGNLYLQSADGTNPGLISTGAQTLAGGKTFSSTIRTTAAMAIGNSNWYFGRNQANTEDLGLLAIDSSNRTLLRSAGDLYFQTSNSNRWIMSGADGHLIPEVTNTFNIGTATKHVNAILVRNVVNDNNGHLYITTNGANDIFFRTNGLDRWVVGASGNLRPVITDQVDLGTPSHFVKAAYIINGHFSGECFFANPNAYRIAYGNYGTFWRQDSTHLYLMVTTSGDPHGGWTGQRPIMMSLSTGICNINGNAATVGPLPNNASLSWFNSSSVSRGVFLYSSSNNTIIRNFDAGSIRFQTDTTVGGVQDRWVIEAGGHFVPHSNSAFDVGSISNNVRDIFVRRVVNYAYNFLEVRNVRNYSIDFYTNDVWRWSIGSPNGNLFCPTDGANNIGVDSASNRAGRGHFRYAVTVGGTALNVPFTGTHRYVLASGVEALPGQAMCLNDNLELEVCSTPSGLDCVGVLTGEYLDGHVSPPSDLFDSTGYIHPSGTNIYHVASVGDSVCDKLDGVIVCDENGNISKGDLLVTSSVSGCLMRQDDDIIRSCTIAKSMDAVDFSVEGPVVSGIYGFLYCG